MLTKASYRYPFIGLYKFLGIDTTVFDRLSFTERSNLAGLLSLMGFFAIFVFIGSYAALWQLYPDQIWIVLLTTYSISILFMVTLRSVSKSCIENIPSGNTLKSLFATPSCFLGILFAYIIILTASTGLSVSLSSTQIKTLQKKNGYTTANNNYIRQIKEINAVNIVRAEQYSQVRAQNYVNHLIKSKPSLYTYKDSLVSAWNKSIDEDFLKLTLFYITKKNQPGSDTNESMLKLSSAVKYPANLPTGFMQKTDSIYSYNGIRFSLSPAFHIIENYNDSIYNTLYRLSVSRAIQKALTSSSTNVEPQQNYPPDGSTVNSLLADVTQTWLHSLVKSDQENIRGQELLEYFFRLFFGRNINILLKTLMPILSISLIFIYYIVLLLKTRNSSYPYLLQRLNKNRKTQLNIDLSRLEEQDLILKELSAKQTADVSAENRDILLKISKVDSIESHIGYARYYSRKKNYAKAIEWLDEGYQKFRERPGLGRKATELLKEMANIYQLAGDTVKSNEQIEKYRTEFNKITIKENRGKPLSLDTLEIKNHYFYDDLHWKFKPGINVLLGKNGYGKSHLLSILLGILQNDLEQTTRLILNTNTKSYLPSTKESFSIKINDNKEFPLTQAQQQQIDAHIKDFRKTIMEQNGLAGTEKENEDFDSLVKNAEERERAYLTKKLTEDRLIIKYSNHEIISEYGKIGILAIPDTRFIDKSSSRLKHAQESIDLVGDGAKQFIYQISYSSVIENFFYDVCSEKFERDQFSYKASMEEPAVIELIKDIYKQLTGIQITSIEVEKPTTGHFEMYVTTDDLVDRLPIQKVSQGTFSIITMLGIIFTYLKLIYREEKVPERDIRYKEAIVVIDEIDAHIHPSWQQKIINILRQTFPKVQFIVTAHSPFIVAGCSEQEVALLRKDPNTKRYSLTQFNQAFIGCTPDELCRLLFDIEKYDENFVTYISQTPRKKSIEERIAMLKKEISPDSKQAMELETLNYELYRILKAESKLKEQRPNH